MKKISLFFLTTTLFSMQTQMYYFFMKENYKEYFKNRVIDRDYSSFSDMQGIGFKMKYKLLKAKLEILTGNAIYDGSTQSGKKLKVKIDNNSLLNLLLSFGKNINLDLGYRLWNRGKSNFSGDYEEQYYWPYIGVSINYKINSNNLTFIPSIAYEKAINPKLTILIGNNPTLDLGNTNGYNIELPLFYKINDFQIFCFYRYEYWHIKPSKLYPLRILDKSYFIFEPESKTRNQYIGIGLNFSF